VIVRLFTIILGLVLELSILCTSAVAATSRPDIKVRFLEPERSNTVSGIIQVRLKFEPEPGASMPKQAVAGIGGAPWVPMTKAESGEWIVRLDTSLAPNGPGAVRVVSDQRFRHQVNHFINITNELKCFFSDMHSHTSYSDGVLTPKVAHDYARDVAKLDVFALTDHLQSLTTEEWADICEQADKANADGAFTTFRGVEWTKPVGHACVYNPPTLDWPDDLEGFYKAAADRNVLVKFNHPGDGTSAFNGLAYSEIGDRAVELMEVRSTKEELAYIRALNQGWRLAPDGSDDTHTPNWGGRRAWSGIWAPALSRKNIMEALKSRRCFSTQDKNCRLIFTANGVMMGSAIEEPVSLLNMEVRVEDPDAKDRVERIELFQDGKVVETTNPQGAHARWSKQVKVEPGSHYYFVKITQADTNSAWSAPIWAKGQ
jgi:hypothetical protein